MTYYFRGDLDCSVIRTEVPTDPRLSMAKRGVTMAMAGLHRSFAFNPTHALWQCSGCGKVAGDGSPLLNDELYGDEKVSPILIPTLPDGNYRLFCEGCCCRCSVCRQTVFRKQCDGPVCLGCFTPVPAAPTTAVAKATAAPKRLISVTIGQMLGLQQKAAVAPVARVLLTGDRIGEDPATKTHLTASMYAAIRKVAYAAILGTFGLNPASVTLIGNGLTWCDHLATDLFVTVDGFKGLEIYQEQFDAGRAMAFSTEALGSPLASCDHETAAVKRGYKCYTDMKRPVAAAAASATHIVAFTWSPSPRFVENPAWAAWCASRPVGKRSSHAVHHSLHDLFGIQRPKVNTATFL